jgi:hypothetical protein
MAALGDTIPIRDEYSHEEYEADDAMFRQVCTSIVNVHQTYLCKYVLIHM